MRAPIALTLLLGVVGSTLPAAGDETESPSPSAARLERQPYASGDGHGREAREALVYLPKGYDSEAGRRWPLILFLHGNGERGDGRGDLDWVGVHGPLYEAWVQKRDLPFVILAPQLPLFGLDKVVPYIRDRDPSSIPRRLSEGVPARREEFPTPSPMTGATAVDELPHGPEGPPNGWPRREADLVTLLDLALERFAIDPARVYLTGLSYGGFGAWYLASRHPRRFAAVAPVVGWGHPELMGPLAARRMPIWVFAGGRDSAVEVKYFYAGLNELERLGHHDFRFTNHEDSGHDAWKRIYAGRDLYDWFLEHRLPDDERKEKP